MTSREKTYYRGQTDNPSDIGQYWTTDRDAAIHYATNGLRQGGYLLEMTARLTTTETSDSVLCWGPEECDKHIGTAQALAGPDSIIGATSNITGYYIPDAADMTDLIEVSEVSPDGDDDEPEPETEDRELTQADYQDMADRYQMDIKVGGKVVASPSK